MAVGFFGLFVSFVQNLPQLPGTQLFLVPYGFLCIFFAGGEVCPGASIAALQQRVPGPSLSHPYQPSLVN